jgi:nitrogen fixation protein FixH
MTPGNQKRPMTAATKWIIAIVGLLAINVSAQVALAVTATNGNTQIIPEYYDKGVHYDDAIDQATKTRALGWHASAVIAGGALVVVVVDRHGAPLVAHVHVTGYQRAHANDVIDLELARGDDGRYHAAIPSSRLGTHDLTIAVTRGDERFVAQAVVEAR